MSDELLRRRAKDLIRRRFRSHRQSIPGAAAAKRSAALYARLLEQPALCDAAEVALFWPMVDRNEVDLRPLDEILRARGVGIAYPRIGDDDALAFLLVADTTRMVPHAMGFFEPPADAPRALALDAIVVPGLAFDPRGHRIGYGAGYYDRALAAHSDVVSIGVAFDFQLAADLPNTDGDVAVDWIVTDGQTLAAMKA
jgi:5-formyltetrahydrofolate cyclo-ligase